MFVSGSAVDRAVLRVYKKKDVFSWDCGADVLVNV
jgi:hypothetical protein